MKIKFLGAAGTVTGSSYVLTSSSGESIVIDLGMFQGDKELEKRNLEPYDYDCSQLTGAVLTHAHLDHCGRLPILLKKGFRGTIHMTHATRDLAELSLLDSAKIAKLEAKKHGDGAILYDKELALETISRFKTHDYHESFSIGPFTIFFRDAGHLLGSAIVEIEDTSASDSEKIVFSGDLGNTPSQLLRDTEFLNEADFTVVESTYGDRLHPKEDPAEKIKSEILEVEKSGGTLLIPAFSMDRTQELLHIIMHLKAEGEISAEIPVFLDSPMAETATAIYLKFSNLFNAHVKSDMENDNAFEFPGFTMIHTPKESKQIWDVVGPKVIIAGAGMMTGGRIVRHAGYYLPNRLTRLLIVGYQGEGTLGRELLEGAKQVHIEGKAVAVNASIESTSAMSSHADQAKLIEWLKSMKGLMKVFITHGEDTSREALAQKIREEIGITDIVLPNQNQETEA